MKNLLTAGALLVASSQAFAGVVIETDSFGTQGSVTVVPFDGLNETISIAPFNVALGTLTGVSVEVFGQIDSEGLSENASAGSLMRAAVELELEQDWLVTTAAADDYIFATDGTVLAGDESVADPARDIAFGEFWEFDITTGEFSGFLTNVNMAAFTTGSNVDFTFSGEGDTDFDNDFTVTRGRSFNEFETGSWGQVQVTYTFEDIATSVPETGSLAIFGLGLAGFALSRRAKKSV